MKTESLNDSINQKLSETKKNMLIRHKVGLLLASIHFIIASCIVYPVIKWPDAQWQMIWIYFLFLDFPLSIAQTMFCLTFFHIEKRIPGLPYPICDVGQFVIPFIVYVIIGSLWYFYLPSLICKIKFFKPENTNEATPENPEE